MMKKNYGVAVALLVAMAVIGNGTAHAAKGGKGKPNEEPLLFDAASLEFGDGIGDGLSSDGLGRYTDGLGGVQCIADDNHGSALADMDTGPSRSVKVSFGSCISTVCDTPFSVAAVVSGFEGHGWWDESVSGYRFPNIAETLTDADSISPGGGQLYFEANGRKYRLGFHGDVTGTGFDDNFDGIRDRIVLTASASTVFDLQEIVLTIVTRGKKTTTTRDFVLVGEYTGMPFSVTLRSSGYTRDRVPNRF